MLRRKVAIVAVAVLSLAGSSSLAEVRVIANLLPGGSIQDVSDLVPLLGGTLLHSSGTQVLAVFDEDVLPAFAVSPSLNSAITDVGCSSTQATSCVEAPVLISVSTTSLSARDSVISRMEAAGGVVIWEPPNTPLFGAEVPTFLLDILADRTDVTRYSMSSRFGPTSDIGGSPNPVAPPLNLGEGHRFYAQVTFESPKRGFGIPRLVNQDSGGLTFFDQANLEILVKVLDACAINDRFWVFASGLTDVGVTLVVGDRLEDVERTYESSLGTPFELIRDIDAFACP